MAGIDKVALAQYAVRGKSYLVLLRSTGDRLVMQQLYHADEVRDVDEVPAPRRASKEAEVKLARQLVDQIAEEKFRPERYTDVVRDRIAKLIQRKVKGEDITEAPEETRPKAEVIDLMAALKASLAQKGPRSQGAARKSGGRSTSSRSRAR